MSTTRSWELLIGMGCVGAALVTGTILAGCVASPEVDTAPQVHSIRRLTVAMGVFGGASLLLTSGCLIWDLPLPWAALLPSNWVAVMVILATATARVSLMLGELVGATRWWSRAVKTPVEMLESLARIMIRLAVGQLGAGVVVGFVVGWHAWRGSVSSGWRQAALDMLIVGAASAIAWRKFALALADYFLWYNRPQSAATKSRQRSGGHPPPRARRRSPSSNRKRRRKRKR